MTWKLSFISNQIQNVQSVSWIAVLLVSDIKILCGFTLDPFESIAFWVLEQATEFSSCNGAQVLWIDLYVGL